MTNPKKGLPAIKFDADAQHRFLVYYRQTGMFYKAAQCAGVCGQTVRTCIKNDEAFADAFDEAKGQYRDALEEEIHRRAVEGVEEYVTTSKGLVYVDTGEKRVVTINGKDFEEPVMAPLKRRIYSDSLLMFHTRKHNPDYREKAQLDVNHTGGVLLIPAGKTVAQWEAENVTPVIEAKAVEVAK